MKKAVALILFAIIVIALIAFVVFSNVNNSPPSMQNRNVTANSTVNATGNVMVGTNVTKTNVTSNRSGGNYGY